MPPKQHPPREEDEEQQQQRYGEDNDEDDEDAFLDLDDPEMQIMDESGDDRSVSEEGEEGQDDDQNDGEEDEAAEGSVAPEGELPVDKDPERDDAVAVLREADGKPVQCVTAHPTNPRLAVCGTENDTAVVFSWEDGAHGADARVVATLTGHTDTITQVAFSPNGSILATGGMDGTVRLWNTATWELLHELVDLGGEVEALLWHPTGAVLVGGGAGASAVLWNAAKGTTAQYFAGHRDAVRCLAWSLDVKKLVTGSADGGVALFNPKTAEMEVNVSRDMSPDGAGVTALSVLPSASAPQETIVLAGCEDGTLHIVSLAGKGRVLKHLPELHSQGVESVTQGPPALGFIATCSCDGLLILWNLHDFTVRSTFKCGEGFTKVMWVAASLVVACTDGDVRVWDSRGDETAPPTRHLLGHRRLVLDVALNADATHIVTAADDGSARVFPLA